jgi:hypothetical protein
VDDTQAQGAWPRACLPLTVAGSITPIQLLPLKLCGSLMSVGVKLCPLVLLVLLLEGLLGGDAGSLLHVLQVDRLTSVVMVVFRVYQVCQMIEVLGLLSDELVRSPHLVRAHDTGRLAAPLTRRKQCVRACDTMCVQRAAPPWP